MVASKKIVLWGRADLLSFSVELFLTSQKGWIVFNISNEESLPALIREVDKVIPDVVIIQHTDQVDHMNLLGSLLREHPNLKVIIVYPDSNIMEVYGKQDILITSASDFTAMVEADFFQAIEQRY